MREIINYIVETFQFQYKKDGVCLNPSSLEGIDWSSQISLKSDNLILSIEKFPDFSENPCEVIKISMLQHLKYLEPIQFDEFLINLDSELDEIKVNINNKLSKFPLLKQRLREWKLKTLLNQRGSIQSN